MIYAANFKTNHTRASTKVYMEALQEKVAEKKSEDKVYIFPPATALDSFDGDFTVGAQNAYVAQNGAYTGEIGLEQLEEFAIETILIGHSERREKLFETQAIVAEKFNFFKNNGFEIIYCIGEPLNIREEGEEAVMEYLLAQFDGIDTSYENFILAYEPIWAIGTGRTASVEEIANTHVALKKIVQKPILYGGSVKPGNIKEIVAIDGVDGALIGGASLDVETFSEIFLG